MSHTGLRNSIGRWLALSVGGAVLCGSSNINYLVVISGMFVWLPSDSQFGRFYPGSFLVIILGLSWQKARRNWGFSFSCEVKNITNPSDTVLKLQCFAVVKCSLNFSENRRGVWGKEERFEFRKIIPLKCSCENNDTANPAIKARTSHTSPPWTSAIPHTAHPSFGFP